VTGVAASIASLVARLEGIKKRLGLDAR